MSSTNFVKGTGIPNGNSLNNVSVSISTLYALSFYSPIILMVSILAFGLFSSSLMKSFVYLFCGSKNTKYMILKKNCHRH